MNDAVHTDRDGRAADFGPLLRAAAPLHPQRLAISILGGHAREGRLVWSGGLVESLLEFGFSRGAARVALGRLVKNGLLARVRDGRFIDYRLTESGEALMVEGDRRLFSFGRADRSIDGWTLVWHAMPDAERAARSRMARRLRFLGFGSLQEATWVAPHDTREEVGRLLADMGMADYSVILAGGPANGLDVEAVVRRAWNLEEVARRYAAFIAALTPFVEPPEHDRDAFVVWTLLVDIFRRFPALDPELPTDPVGVHELRHCATELFQTLFTALATAARRHFDESSRPTARASRND